MEINNNNADNNATQNIEGAPELPKRGRGRPKGSVNKNAAYVRVPFATLIELLGEGAKIQIPVKRDFIENLLGSAEDDDFEALSVQVASVDKAEAAPLAFTRTRSLDVDAGDEQEDERDIDWQEIDG